MPSSSQPANKAVQRRAPWHRQTKGPRLRAKLPRYKEGTELQGESVYKKHKAAEPMAGSVGPKRSAVRMEAGDPTGSEKTEDDCWCGSVQTTGALFTAAQVTSATKTICTHRLLITDKSRQLKHRYFYSIFTYYPAKINMYK